MFEERQWKGVERSEEDEKGEDVEDDNGDQYDIWIRIGKKRGVEREGEEVGGEGGGREVGETGCDCGEGNRR